MSANPNSFEALLESVKTGPLTPALALGSKIAEQGALPLLDLFVLAERLNGEQRTQEVVDLYRCWLQHTPSPLAYAAHFNLAVSLSNLGRDGEAEVAYRTAIAQKPDFIEAHLNLGTLLERIGQAPAALDIWRKVPGFGDPASKSDSALHVQAWNNLGRLLEIRKELAEAEQMLRNSLLLDPSQKNPLTHYVHLRQKQCEWPIYQPFAQITEAQMHEATSALALLSASNDPAAQLAAAKRFVAEKVDPPEVELAPRTGYAHRKLRVAYLSSDFCSHAVSILTAELYELHDRDKIKLYGFSWSREDGTPLRARVVKALDNYIAIHKMSDREAAECIRGHEIDILVDLHGLTSGTRPGILALRPAPVQITYLGFPGTTGLPQIDYVLADRFVLPPELATHFSEKPLYMPDCFQINDRQREIGAALTREQCGLPPDGFVFCSFNNNFKFSEEMFDCWMRILARVPHSVLWLVSDNEQVRQNLQQRARTLGVEPQRLYFAPRVGPLEYLARFACADLFLDTFPFNAGTTASDALWAGLPLLTYSGQTFASRMAGSILQAVDLPDLITFNLADYEEKAVSLAHQPEKIAAMKQQLAQNKLSCKLFDSPQFVRDLEAIFERIAVMNPDATPEEKTETPAAAASEMKQTPINQVANVDVLNLMRPDFNMVVEVGSSSGVLARAYRNINPACKYVGIEIDPDYAEASKAHCTEVLTGNVEHLPDAVFERLGEAQCWVFADALEHLYDPWALLRRIRRHAKGPLEIISCIPNAQHWGLQAAMNGGKFFYQDSGLLDRTHIRWFTRITIFDLYQSTGFQIAALNARMFNLPGPEMVAAIRNMAIAAGNDPDQAEKDAVVFQYVSRALALPEPR
jgi:predicted O-linked N-acetylglucosamine transferase (SPINDLY family)